MSKHLSFSTLNDQKRNNMISLFRYMTANLMHYTQGAVKDNTKLYMAAARKGRSLQDCNMIYSACNEII